MEENDLNENKLNENLQNLVENVIKVSLSSEPLRRHEIRPSTCLNADIVNCFIERMQDRQDGYLFKNTYELMTRHEIVRSRLDHQGISKPVFFPFYKHGIPGHFILVCVFDISTTDELKKLIYWADSLDPFGKTGIKEDVAKKLKLIFHDYKLQVIDWGFQQEGFDCGVLTLIHLMIMIHVLDRMETINLDNLDNRENLRLLREERMNKLNNDRIWPENRGRDVLNHFLDRIRCSTTLPLK